MSARAIAEVAGVFLRLGCLSFGGPTAHLGHLHAELVVNRRWLDDARYADLVALCQFLPGPASSQVVFALGMHRAGLLGALAASACFTLPSALLMLGFAYGLARAPEVTAAGWLHGLRLAAVAVVAQAVWGMGQRLCPDRERVTLAALAAAALLAWPSAAMQLAVIAAGAAAYGRHRGAAAPATAALPATAAPPGARRAAGAALALFAVLLGALPALARATGSMALATFDAFYRAGALVFGGGHVVLPLLRAELVPRGWLTDDQFLAGYAAAQALPGPLFTLSAYLGAALRPGPGAWLYGLWCLLAMFAPGWLLVGGALPFWDQLRARPAARALLAGANAAVVGVLLAALYTPVITESVRGPRDAAIALLGWVALERWRCPPWALVAACAAIGQLTRV